MKKPIIKRRLILKAIMFLCIAPFTVIITYMGARILTPEYAIYAIVAIFTSSIIFVYPYLSNIARLIEYVDNLSQNRNIKAPNLSFLSITGHLSESLARLHRSWSIRNQQLEISLIEKEILLDILPNILLLINRDGEVLKTNSAARDMFGENIVGMKVTDVAGTDEFSDAITDLLQRHIRPGLEFYLPTKRKHFRAQFRYLPTSLEEGIIAVVALHDISKRKETERMQADFIANASHEMRTPLASITGFIETLQNMGDDDPGARKEFLGIMSEQADRMSNLVTDLLSLSKIESSEANFEEISMRNVINNITKHNEFLASQNNVKVITKMPQRLPKIKADEAQISQVLENLLANAIKYGNSGKKVEVIASITHPPKEPVFENHSKTLCVSVRDYGAGIPDEHIPRLTERFYRVDKARSRKIGGTGLGLAIVKHILDHHGGVLEIKSQVKKGSTFSFYLPVS